MGLLGCYMDYGFDWFKSIPQWLFGLDAGLSEKVFVCKLTKSFLKTKKKKEKRKRDRRRMCLCFSCSLMDPYPVGHKFFLLSCCLEAHIQLVTCFYFFVAWGAVSSWS